MYSGCRLLFSPLRPHTAAIRCYGCPIKKQPTIAAGSPHNSPTAGRNYPPSPPPHSFPPLVSFVPLTTGIHADIGCPQKRNGNTSLAATPPPTPPTSGPAMTCRSPCRTTKRTLACPRSLSTHQSPASRQILSASTTLWATSRSGCTTGTLRTLPTTQSTPLDLSLARLVSPAEDHTGAALLYPPPYHRLPLLIGCKFQYGIVLPSLCQQTGVAAIGT